MRKQTMMAIKAMHWGIIILIGVKLLFLFLPQGLRKSYIRPLRMPVRGL